MRTLTGNEINKTSGGFFNFSSWFSNRPSNNTQTPDPVLKDQVSVCWFDNAEMNTVDPTAYNRK